MLWSRYTLPLSHFCHYTHIQLGGWVPETGVIFKDINEEIDQAFSNVDLALKTAGGKGWSQVFRINSYHVPIEHNQAGKAIDSEAMKAMVRNFEKWMPGHQPLWTCVGVPNLGEGEMRVEIEVVAHDIEGAKAAGTI